MEPTSLFVLYFLALSSLWLLVSAVNPVLAVVANVGSMLPVGRRAAALVVSVVLISGVIRPNMAAGSTGPPSERMVEMVAEEPASEVAFALPAAMTLLSSGDLGSYTVEAGDSLWRIARHILSNDGVPASGSSISDLWRSMYVLNETLIGDDPNLIHPGQVLQLPTR